MESTIQECLGFPLMKQLLPSSKASLFRAAKAFGVTWPRIRNRNELTERDWENAVQELGKSKWS